MQKDQNSLEQQYTKMRNNQGILSKTQYKK